MEASCSCTPTKEHHAQVRQGDEEDRLRKAAACPKVYFSTNRGIKWGLLFCLLIRAVCGDEDQADILAGDKNETLFVSLGSSCDPVVWLKYLGRRKAAFPFDWLLCIDGPRVIELIDSDFRNFLDRQYLTSSNGVIYHTYYYIEFRHEHEGLEAMLSKYERRIARFHDLGCYPGKVVFIRAPYAEATAPHVHWPSDAGLRITKEEAMQLQTALRKRFPSLDFTLLIVNHEGDDNLEILDNIVLATRRRTDVESILRLIEKMGY